MSTRIGVIVGNPKPASRTLAAAVRLANELTRQEPDLVVDLATIGPGLLTWGDEEVERLVAQTRDADLLVVASPTYKATYTGLLKVFLDRIPYDGLAGVTAVPLMLGSGPGHAMATEVGLRPVLVELGATVPTRGLYLVDAVYDDPNAFTDWIAAARPLLGDVLSEPLLEGTPS
jgi:FMN reductase